jgi:hypothetical protein
LHYPMPNYRKVKPKVNTYNTPTTGSENRERSPLNLEPWISDERNPTVLDSLSEKRANNEECSATQERANPPRVVRVSLASQASVPCKPESRDFRSKLPIRVRPILHYPMTDFSKVKPKVNAYNTPTTGSENREALQEGNSSVDVGEARNTVWEERTQP